MKLDDFLKCKKVKCVQAFGFHSTLTVGKVYDVKGLSERHVHICNDANNVIGYEFSLFEPVTDLPKSAENPLQNIELTPEFEVVEPRFKVGDPVYFDLSGRIAVIEKLDESNDFSINNSGVSEGLMKNVCLANQENYDRLQATFPYIKFEQPPKPLTGDELVRAMLKKGIKNVLCLWGSGDKIIIDRLDYKGSLMSTNCNIVGGLTPIDWYTGEPLTEAVLDEN